MSTTQTITPVFDTAKPIRVTVQSGDEKKTAELTFGQDAFWFERNRKQPTTRRNLGRNKTITENNSGEVADHELFNRLRVDQDGPEFDDFEAAAAVAKLERNEITNVSRTGEGYQVEMTALGCDLLHVLKVPTQKDVIEFSRSSVRIIDGRKTQDIRIFLEPAEALYKRLLVRTEGYASAAPIIHQAAVVSEIINDLQSGEDDVSFT